MMQNAAFLAALTVFVFAGWLAAELTFLVPYKALLFQRHGLRIGLAAVLLFLNLLAIYYAIGRWLFLRDTGRKLLHVDRQLTSPDAVLEDLRQHLKS
jgi:hypothetical protein